MQHTSDNPDCVCLDCIKTTRQAALVWVEHCRKKHPPISLAEQIEAVENDVLETGSVKLAAALASLKWLLKNQDRLKEKPTG